jgi:hypothetical protein
MKFIVLFAFLMKSFRWNSVVHKLWREIGICILGQKVSFLAEAQPRLENRREQKALFGRGAHYIFLGGRTNYKAKDIIGKITNVFCIYFFHIDTFVNTY